MAKISVIVPVYNTEKYVEKCLDSLINQTIKNQLEIIIINDGSTDNSEEVIKQYIQTHKNQEEIKYYAKENEGIAKTRNFGIEKATSDYILFVDSDDYIDYKLIEKLNPYIEKQIDLVKFKLQRVNQKGEVIEKVTGPTFENLTGEEAFRTMFSEDSLIDSPCVYLIKKELFTKHHFQFQRTYHEDFGLIPLILLVAKSVVSISDYLYSYVQVENSITRNEDYQKTIKKMEDVIAHYDNMLQEIEKLLLSETAKEDVKTFYTNSVLLKLNELKENDKDAFIHQLQERKVYRNIKAKNLKQLLKKILIRIDIKLYLKMR